MTKVLLISHYFTSILPWDRVDWEVTVFKCWVTDIGTDGEGDGDLGWTRFAKPWLLDAGVDKMAWGCGAGIPDMMGSGWWPTALKG